MCHKRLPGEGSVGDKHTERDILHFGVLSQKLSFALRCWDHKHHSPQSPMVSSQSTKGFRSSVKPAGLWKVENGSSCQLRLGRVLETCKGGQLASRRRPPKDPTTIAFGFSQESPYLFWWRVVSSRYSLLQGGKTGHKDLRRSVYRLWSSTFLRVD